MGYDFRLYQASDQLWRHKEGLEQHLYDQERSLFNLEETITLFDLTNTFFEGEAQGASKAQRGRSKEKRSDCPLITLGLVLDGSGFPRRSQLFPGNVSEPESLEAMLGALQCRKRSGCGDRCRHCNGVKHHLAQGAGLSLSGGKPQAQA
ncbi:MAG: hypothetical protein L3J26_09055 [Candidatus Polarisedimenticolaceae bacterium]|nr:hypothetical protein [Candidatus Polarisedimenticolaceae bacterium]